MPTGDSLDLFIRLGAYVAPPLAALGAWGIAKYVRSLHLEKELADAQKQKADAEGRLAEATRSFDDSREAYLSRYDHLRSRFEEARDKFYRIRKVYLELRDQQVSTPEPPIERGPAETIAKVEAERDEARREVERLEQQISEITRFDGRLWLREPVGPIPPFCPLTDRKPIIISVLNLKGGVGKTTVTANLAATLARPDSPALMIDLDYQRSLSMLLVDSKERILLHRGGLTIQRFLASDDHGPASLTTKIKDLGADVPNCWVLTNSDARGGGHATDSLEETENRLMVEWLLDRRRSDPRFFLREALHGPGLDYGYVFLDCPPRLTTACVNALAASDFVLIPVVPDPVSTRAVENLLRTLIRFRDELFPELTVLGVVPNMVRFNNQGGPIRDHADALTELKAAVAEVWDLPFPIFESYIKHDSAFGKSAAHIDADGKVRLAVADPKIGPAFQALGKELEKEIRRHASRRPAAVPAKPGIRARSGR